MHYLFDWPVDIKNLLKRDIRSELLRVYISWSYSLSYRIEYGDHSKSRQRSRLVDKSYHVIHRSFVRVRASHSDPLKNSLHIEAHNTMTKVQLKSFRFCRLTFLLPIPLCDSESVS